VTAPRDEPPEQGRRDGRIQSVERAVALLRAIAGLPQDAATLQTLADRCHLKRSTAWRILATLEHHGLVDRRDGAYTIGYAAAQLAGAAGVDGVVRRAHSVLERIAVVSGETANLAVVRRLGLYYVDQASGTRADSASWLGRQVPLHATSSGKAYLAWLTDDEVREAVGERPIQFTDTTITDLGQLQRELVEARARGFATCSGELEVDSYGVSAPVLDPAGRPAAVVALWGPLERVTPRRFNALGHLAAEAAADIARLLEYV
jgi:DNA-binding IclR family transcriptional regulator